MSPRASTKHSTVPLTNQASEKVKELEAQGGSTNSGGSEKLILTPPEPVLTLPMYAVVFVCELIFSCTFLSICRAPGCYLCLVNPSPALTFLGYLPQLHASQFYSCCVLLAQLSAIRPSTPSSDVACCDPPWPPAGQKGQTLPLQLPAEIPGSES